MFWLIAPAAALALIAQPVAASRADNMLNAMQRRRRDDEAWIASQVQTPPERYASTGRYMFEIVPFEEVQTKCRAAGDGRSYRLACALGRAPNPVVIVITEPTDPRIRKVFAAVVEHEIAHPQGWSADHPN